MPAAQAAPTVPTGEIRSLTGLRIVAAVWVVVFHFSFTPGDAYSAVEEPLAPLIRTGALGVDLFYVLSGFVIALTYLDKMGSRLSARRSVGFLWARICRIWPVYALVTTLFGAWLLFKGSRVSDGFVAYQLQQPVVDVQHYLQQLLMVQLWGRPTFDGSSWVGAAWSISAEWLAYVCFPLAVLLLWRLRNAPALVNAGLAVAAMAPFGLICLTTGAPYFPWSWLLRIAAGFLAGALTCLAVRRIQRTAKVERIASGVAVLVLVEILVGLWWGHWRGQGEGEYGGVVVLLFPVLVGALALSRTGLSRVLATEPMVHGGRISYSLYLVHIPVFEILWTSMEWHPVIGAGSGLGALLVPHVLLATVLLAHLTYRYVEEPSRLFLRGRGPGRWAVQARPTGTPAGTAASFPRPRPAAEAAAALGALGALGAAGAVGTADAVVPPVLDAVEGPAPAARS